MPQHRGGYIRRDAETIPILEPNEIKEICDRATCSRDECLVALLYLTGRRIGEVLPLQKKDFKYDQEKNVVSFKCRNEKTYRFKRIGKYTIQVVKTKRVYDEREKVWRSYSSIWYEQIEPMFSTIGPSGRLLARFVLDHLDSLQDEDSYVFAPIRKVYYDHIKRSQAYKIVRKLDERLWLHALRHMDFTRLYELYKDDLVSMHTVTFHKKFESTLAYVKKKKIEDMVVKM